MTVHHVNLGNLGRELSRTMKDREFPEFSEEVFQKTAIQLSDGVIADTPVGNPDLWESPPPPGYAGGRARGNWQADLSTAPEEELDTLDPGGGPTQEAAQGVALQTKFKHLLFFLANNVPYIERLNDGWSSQQPANFVERNIQAVKAQLR